MNREEILELLLGRAGGACPDRGVRADDIVIGRYASMPVEEREAFWRAFGEAIAILWRNSDVEAIEAASAIVAGLDKAVRPSVEQASSAVGFLLNDPVILNGALAKGEERRRVVAALRMLASLGQGERLWWRKRFLNWIHDAKTARDEEGQLAWQAVLHASLGLMNGNEEMPRIDTWLEEARLANEFPAIELFTLLARQTPYQPDKDHFKDAVIEAYQSLYANCGIGGACPRGVEDIRTVIETWLVDRQHLTPDEASRLLSWQPPATRLPQDRLFDRRRQATATVACA